MVEIARRLNELGDARFIAARERERRALYDRINEWLLRFEAWSKERLYAEAKPARQRRRETIESRKASE